MCRGTITFSSNIGLKVIVNVKGADGAGKVLVRSEETDNILSRTVDNIKGKHTFQFKTGEVPIGGEFEACVHSDKLGKELCMEGKNGPDSEPEKVGVTFQEGLKVIVHFARSDHACVRAVDDSHRAGCKAGNPGDEVVFQFGTGDVEIGEEVYACFQGYDDDCRSVINGPESAPEHIYQLR
jgi:hypothetical protein